MSYPLLDAFLTMMWFFLWILWLFLLIMVIIDIFRNPDLGGLAKAGWLVFAIVLPFLGVLIYLIAHGGRIAERMDRHDRVQDEAFRPYVRQPGR
jgi:predicted permease